MSVLDEKKINTTEAPEELTSESAEELTADETTSETLTLEDLEKDVTTDAMSFTATWHFEFDDILKAIEHMEQAPEPELITESEIGFEPAPEPELEAEPESPEEPEAEAEPEPEFEAEETSETVEPEPDEEILLSENSYVTAEFDDAESTNPNVPAMLAEDTTEQEPAPEAEQEPTPEVEQEFAPEPEPAEKPRKKLLSGIRDRDDGTKRLVLAVIILLVVIIGTIAAGLVVANSIVDNANAANQQKVEEMQANIQEVDLAESLYRQAADQVIEDVAVPTYTLEELYALDLREPTGFTANDLKMITRKGLVGCEEAFVKAEETYGVNSIFLMSIASLESAYGTMMFRPNNMFGYGRTGFSSKQEGIMTVAKGLGTRYLPPGGSLYGGSPTLKGVNKRYAANPQWYYKVGKYMKGYYEELAAEKNGALDKFE